MMQLVWPAMNHLEEYRAALERGWSPDNLRGARATRDELARIAQDPAAFLALQVDPEAKGGPVLLPDGRRVPRLPAYRRWIWDGAFCGIISLRWQAGTPELPPYCLGHIGYSVVPWKRRRGYAKRALGLLLPEAKQATGLPYVEIVTSLDNLASRRVIEGNGGVLVERFTSPYHATPALRFRIFLI